MKVRVLTLALIAGSTFSTAAFAAMASDPHNLGHPSSRNSFIDRCSTLESQYSAAVGDRQSSSRLTKANALFSMGKTSCDDNEVSVGVLRLERALRDIGLRPAA